MGLARAITFYQVLSGDDKLHQEMQRETLITQTPRLHMLSAMARDLRPLKDWVPIMDILARPARPTAPGPRYL